MELSTLFSGTARPMYRIRTKSKRLEANGRGFKLAKGKLNEARRIRNLVQVPMNPLDPRGEVRMTTTSEIRLDFLDVNTDKR